MAKKQARTSFHASVFLYRLGKVDYVAVRLYAWVFFVFLLGFASDAKSTGRDRVMDNVAFTHPF